MVNKMSNTLPKPTRATALPTRERGSAEGKTQEQVIAEATLKTNESEQTNPVVNEQEEDKKPWLKGSNLTEAELMNLTTKKSFNFPLAIQAKLDFVLENRKKEVRGFGQQKPNETAIVLEALNKALDQELKKMGYDPK